MTCSKVILSQGREITPKNGAGREAEISSKTVEFPWLWEALSGALFYIRTTCQHPPDLTA